MKLFNRIVNIVYPSATVFLLSRHYTQITHKGAQKQPRLQANVIGLVAKFVV